MKSALACCGLVTSLFALPAGADRPYTIDEMFKVEDLGPGAFSPQGDVFVYSYKPPYGELPDYSIPFWAPFFGQLRVVDLADTAPAQPLFDAQPGALYHLLSFSPNGRYIAYFQGKDGELKLGLFDRQTRVNRLVETSPDQNSRHELTPTWIGPETLVFTAADPNAVGPYSPYVQRASGEAYYKAWHKSWAGKEPSFTMYRSRESGGDNPPYPGTLRVVDARTGQTTLLADGMFSDFRLSSDGRYLSSLQQFVKSQMPADSLGPPWIFGRTRMVIFDLQTRRRIDVASELDVFSGTMEWSADAPTVGFFAWTGGTSSPHEGRFHLFDVHTGRLRTLEHTGLDLVNEREFGPPGKPVRFVWLGKDIAVAARTNKDGDPTARFTSRGVTGRDMNRDPGRFDWYLLGGGAPRNLTQKYRKVEPWPAGLTKSGAYLILDGEVQRIDRTGAATRIAPGMRIVAKPLSRAGIDYYARTAYGPVTLRKSADAQEQALVAFDLLKGSARKIALPKGHPGMIAASGETGAIAYRETAEDGSDLKVQQADGQTRHVMRINAFLAQVAKPIVKNVSHKGFDGRPLVSCVTFPGDYQQGLRYPTMVFVYPGSTPDCSEPPDLQRASYTNLNVLLANGYALLRVAAPEVATLEGGPLANIVAATDRALDAAIAAGYVDADRIALIGASGAGFSGLWIAGHSQRYKALISINGISNISSHYFTVGLPEQFFPDLGSWDGQATRYEGVQQFGFGLTPWQEPALYWRISPIAYARDINVPVLLVGTDMDIGGFSQQYDEMFVALHRLRKEVDYVKYWGEGHGPSSAANVRNLTERTLAWLDRYLGPGPKAPDTGR